MAIENELILTTDTSLLIVPGSKQYAVTTIIVCNYASVTTTSYDTSFTLHVIKSGESKSNSNMILNSVPVRAQETFTFSLEKIILDAGDSIVLIAADNDRLSATISYLEV